MYDISELREKHNCIEVISREIGEPAKGRGYYASWKCPFCGEHSNSTFTAWADCWKCWKGCNQGDVIRFIELYHNMTFSEACAYLGGQTNNNPQPKRENAPRPDEKPRDEWVEDATLIVSRAIDTLWSNQGKMGMDYLKSRGFTEETISYFGFGYIPQKANQTVWRGIRLFHGVVIPTWREKLWNARIRTNSPNPEYRYLNFSGGKLRGSLFGSITGYKPIILTEGDFNAAMIYQACGGYVDSVSTSAATNHLSAYWLNRFLTAPCVLVWGDDDKAGRGFCEHHQKLGYNWHSITTDQDANDMYLSGGLENFIKDTLSGLLDDPLQRLAVNLGGVLMPASQNEGVSYA